MSSSLREIATCSDVPNLAAFEYREMPGEAPASSIPSFNRRPTTSWIGGLHSDRVNADEHARPAGGLVSET